MATKQMVFFVSESTAITAEALGSSILSQFPDGCFQHHYRPFINTPDKAIALVEEIDRVFTDTGNKSLVFATMPHSDIDNLLKQADCYYYELFASQVRRVAADTGQTPLYRSGLSHGLINQQSYDNRMDIVNYALNHDDAINLNNLAAADVILIGVSRSGKTPTSLYLALHFGICVANYPLTEDDFERNELPQTILTQHDKLLALTIQPQRLTKIREKRNPGSNYATLVNCQSEVQKALHLYHRHRLDILDVTTSSIEELAARIIRIRNLEPRHQTLTGDEL